jgi:hypothetical protein
MQIDLNEIEVHFEEVTYQNGTKRKTFNFNEWIELIFKTR